MEQHFWRTRAVLKIFFTVVLNNDSNDTTTVEHATNFPTKAPSTSARLFSHTARRNVPLPLLQRFSEKKSGTTDLETVPDAEE